MCIILFMFDGIMLISAKLPILLDSQSLTLRRVGNFWIQQTIVNATLPSAIQIDLNRYKVP